MRSLLKVMTETTGTLGRWFGSLAQFFVKSLGILLELCARLPGDSNQAVVEAQPRYGVFDALTGTS